ncbi:MAG: UDP-N-acetylmuramoyl-tripeptide--D-alanyl-D-alanine ligase [Gilvibacter sp.]
MTIAQLHQLFLASSGVSTDTRKIESNVIFFALKGDNFNGNSFATDALQLGAGYAIIDESEFDTGDKRIVLVNDVLTTLQQLASYHRQHLAIPIIGLTGSNGKTTTKELINAVLSQKFKVTATKGNLNNHIGVPLTLLSLDANTEIGLVEMGANHLKEIAQLCEICKPDYGYITNFGKAHLEGFGSIEGVIKGKSELYDYLRSHKKTAFINTDDSIQMERAKGIEQVLIENSIKEMPIELAASNPAVVIQIGKTTIESNLLGDYNANNIKAALFIGHYFKVPMAAIKRGIETYQPTNNRSQWIDNKRSKLLLDAYNANPSSMKAALSNFAIHDPYQKSAVILGDMFELGNDAAKEHQNIADLAISLNFDNIFLVGENFYLVNNNEKLTKCREYEDLVVAVQKHDFADFNILIKGSRGMALERIVSIL